MSKAFAKKLKSIYTSGDNYTVLTLLEKLIAAVEEYEIEYTAYLHEVKITTETITTTFTFVSPNKTPATLETLELYDTQMIRQVSGMTGQQTQILTVQGDLGNSNLSLMNIVNTTIVSHVGRAITAVEDKVTPI